MRPRPRTAVGSSPLTRGKPQIVQLVGQVGGLIPAHAGKTSEMLVSISIGPAHPRSRGENICSPCMPSALSGSSPLTRGKLIAYTHALRQVRLIPAHAGKTRSTRGACVWPRAHPRSRGENIDRYPRHYCTAGSSPLTRGKHFPTCAFTAQIDQILETLELAVSSGSYSIWVACATDAPQDQVRSIGLVLPSSRGAS